LPKFTEKKSDGSKFQRDFARDEDPDPVGSINCLPDPVLFVIVSGFHLNQRILKKYFHLEKNTGVYIVHFDHPPPLSFEIHFFPTKPIPSVGDDIFFNAFLRPFSPFFVSFSSVFLSPFHFFSLNLNFFPQHPADKM